MASKLKKILHRHKDENVEKSPQQSHAPSSSQPEPGLRTSLYESTAPAAIPQTGDYAIRGNENSVVLQPSRKQSVRSSRSRGSSGGYDNVPYRLPTPHRTPPPPSNATGPGAYDPHQQAPALPPIEQQPLSRSSLPQAFAGLDLSDEQSPTSTSQSGSVPRDAYQGSIPARGSSQAHGYNTWDKAGIRKVNLGDHPSTEYDGPASGEDDDQNVARQISIPRKQVGTSANAPQSPVQTPKSSARQQGHNRNESASKPLPAAPVSSNDIPEDAQNVINRAKSNTYDTTVIEKVAPAVVHETVHQDIHHVREQRITRDIHNHDVYHRILPIVDVEVLPPRHFLPVEGGGLVEISASEVPGRGNNWVIAETASKIPSDQVAPGGTRQFTAREFRGREGDTVRYTAPEGHEVIEETWVHPPELETGARDTGQSWPLELGDEGPEKPSHKHTSSKTGKRKSPRKGQTSQAIPAEKVEELGRRV